MRTAKQQSLSKKLTREVQPFYPKVHNTSHLCHKLCSALKPLSLEDKQLLVEM